MSGQGNSSIYKELSMHENRTLIRGDNLEEMQKFPDACIDLVATDPPFNSKRDYFVPYRDEHGQQPDALIKAFTDTWAWGDAAEDACRHLIVEEGRQIGATIQGLQQFLNETPMMAYLVMMAARIVEMHRILKDTGSLYLHCDPSASHYLKIILDAVFGAGNFRNEIVWCYRGGGVPKSDFSRKHDIIFRYSKTKNVTFNVDDIRLPYSQESQERLKYKAKAFRGDKVYDNYDMNEKGKHPEDWWVMQPIMPSSKERTGYPTQKPLALYERIIQASSNKGDIVLDPFCGCGTTLMAAEKQDRQWIGIDLTYLATGAVKMQIEKFFPNLRDNVIVTGTPEDADTALVLARSDPAGFEEWCVTHVLKFKSNAKKGADGGIDGSYTFPIGKIKGRQAYGKMVAQVKGGNYTLSQVRDFRTAMQNAKADLGVFVVTRKPTRGMLDEVRRAGTYQIDAGGFTVSMPCLQIYQIQDYFKDILPKLPFGERQLL